MLCDVYGHLLSFDGHDFFGRRLVLLLFVFYNTSEILFNRQVYE